MGRQNASDASKRKRGHEIGGASVPANRFEMIAARADARPTNDAIAGLHAIRLHGKLVLRWKATMT
jgi:hypothetical protein